MDNFSLSVLLWLVGLFSAWGALHSLMVSKLVTDWFSGMLGSFYSYYRLLFNSVAGLSFIAVIAYSWSVQQPPFFAWEGYYRIAQVALIAAALLLFYLGARGYSMAHFMGIAQLHEQSQPRKGAQVLSSSGSFERKGISAFIRHPWYLGTILILWPRPLDWTALVVNTILTLYVILGTFLEERKLIKQFGASYRAYQQEVSMLLPLKWMQSRLKSQRK